MYTHTSKHGDSYELKLVLRTLFIKKSAYSCSKNALLDYKY